MVYVPEMPRVDAAGAVGSGFDLGQSMGSARTKRKAKNALQRIYEGDKAALAELMAVDPEAGRAIETQMGVAQFVKPGMAPQELAGPTKGGEALTTEAVPPSVDTEGLTAYLASRGDSGALKSLMEKAGPQAAAKWGYSKESAINPQTGQEEYFITDDTGNVKWLGIKPKPEAPKAEKAPEPKMVQGADGQVYWLNPGEQLPEGVTAKGGESKLSQAEFREVSDQEDVAGAAYSAVKALEDALRLNEVAYSGPGAMLRAKARSALPGQSEEADAAILMDSIITEQVLSTLKATFGSAPTEGERKILIEMQASLEKTPEQRRAIIERAIAAAKAKSERARARAESIRSGTFSRPDQQPPQGGQQSGGSLALPPGIPPMEGKYAAGRNNPKFVEYWIAFHQQTKADGTPMTAEDRRRITERARQNGVVK